MIKLGYKWRVHRTMMGDPVLASALPETRLWSKTNLWNMLHRHGSVILKPSGGTGGYAVIQVTNKGAGRFEVHVGNQKRLITGRGPTEAFIKQLLFIGGSKYLIQKRIPLAEIDGSPVDIRVMVQRRKDTPWTVTGHLAKVAGKGYIITNIARGKGSVFPVQKAIALSTAKGVSPGMVVKRMCDLSLRGAQRLGSSPQCAAIGFDMGVDHRGKVWMIEANPQPEVQPAVDFFLKLEDKTMYQRIISFGYPLNP